MDPAELIRQARSRSGTTLRELAEAAATSHSAIAAYEAGTKVPNVATLNRIITAAGFELEATLRPRVDGPGDGARGAELEEVLALAEQFPARHDPQLTYPVFGR